MQTLIEHENFVKPLLDLLEETFEKPIGIYLDANTALFQTLESISAEKASIPVGGKCSSLAAQVAHITYYLEVLERIVIHNDHSPAEWSKIWQTIEDVSPSEWDITRDQLKQAFARTKSMFRSNPVWNADSIEGALAVLAHTAYHLGEIRQALCILG